MSIKKHLKKGLFLAILCFPFFCYSAEGDKVVRAAIDIGSGATKLKVAEVNIKTQKIEKVLFNESFAVQYQEELEKSADGSFNEQVMKTGLDSLKKAKEIAQKYNAEKVIAVATASFRKASNVQPFIDKIQNETGIQVHIIDQDLEGILGFEATTAQLKASPLDVVVWDIGGGSFQFSSLDKDGKVVVYRGVDASIPFKNHIIKNIKLKNPDKLPTPNPLTLSEIKDAQNHAQQISKKVDDVFKKKISDPNTKVVGIGNIFAYGIYPLVGKKHTFTQKELFKNVQSLAGKTDKDLGGHEYSNVLVSNSILVLGFMQKLGIDQMDIIDINNADGALVYADFWKKPAKVEESA